MAEEFRKYKDILDREREEFRHQLEREVSAFLIFLSRQKGAMSKFEWN